MRIPFLVACVAVVSVGCSGLKPVSRNDFVWLTRYDVKTLDPAAVQDWTTGNVLAYMYPSIGKLCDISTDDSKTFTLKLKPSQFSNGTSVTGEDIQFTLERCLISGVESSAGNQYASQISGAKAFSDNPSGHCAGIKVEGDTVTLTLEKTDQAFSSKLSNKAFGVVNHAQVPRDKPHTKFAKGDGAGNWVLDSFSPGSEWKLVNIKTNEVMKVRYAGDSASRRQVFDSGGADYAMFGAHEAGSVRGHKSLDVGGPTTLVYLQLNPKTKPELNVNMRKWMRSFVGSKVDFKQILIDKVRPAKSMVDLSGLTPPDVPLAPTPQKSGLKFEITYADIGMQNPSVEGVIAAFNGAGFKFGGRAMQSAAMLAANAKGEIPILFTGWQPDYEGPLNTIPMLYGSTSSENKSGFKDPAVDALIAKAQAGKDPESNILKAWEHIEQNPHAVPLYIQRDLVLKRKDLPSP